MEGRESLKRNAAKKAERDKRYAQENKEKIAEYQKKYRAANIEKSREYLYAYYHNKLKLYPKFRLVQAVRRGMARMAKAGTVGKMRHVPWTGEELKAHIGRQLLKGMTWGNYGKVWHIDHIVPLAAFQFSTPQEPGFQLAWALSNLRPLWAEDNWKKNKNRTHLL